MRMSPLVIFAAIHAQFIARHYRWAQPPASDTRIIFLSCDKWINWQSDFHVINGACAPTLLYDGDVHKG